MEREVTHLASPGDVRPGVASEAAAEGGGGRAAALPDDDVLGSTSGEVPPLATAECAPQLDEPPTARTSDVELHEAPVAASAVAQQSPAAEPPAVAPVVAPAAPSPRPPSPRPPTHSEKAAAEKAAANSALRDRRYAAWVVHRLRWMQRRLMSVGEKARQRGPSAAAPASAQ
jgi:hypothetical protein